MTNSLCIVCEEKPKTDFVLVEQVLVCCMECENDYSSVLR